jgi:hypothetical protein
VRIGPAGLAFLVGTLNAASVLAQQRLEPPSPLEPKSGNPYIREGDSHYARRQEKRVGAVADRGEIAAAVRAYDTASQAADSLEARWKLARALVFEGLYTEMEPSARQAIFEKARRASEDGIGILERRAKRAGSHEFALLSPEEIASAVRKDPDASPAFYWAAVSWGQWAVARGKEEATRLGAAQKIRDYATVLIALDADFEDGGGYRILGRLHDRAPHMQAETDWVSREEALRNLRLAAKTDSASFANRLYLAEALALGSPAERAEAIRIAEGLVSDAPSPTRIVEELRLQREAAEDLRAWK